MRTYSLRHLADSTLRHDLKQLILTDCGTTAIIVAHIAEFITRKLCLEDGYASMYDYCVGELKMSEDVACRRIRAARAARRFPLIFEALADGRIHLTGISLLAHHLTEETAKELLAASFHKSKREIQLLLAARLPQPDLPTFVASLSTAPATPVSPSAPQVARTVDCDDRHRHRSLYSAGTFIRASADRRPCHFRGDSARARAVWLAAHRTFTSDTGHRCEETKDVQFDHIDPYAKGGKATVSGIRLLCRAHNQFEAERAFGAEFMRLKRNGSGRVQT